MDVIKHIQLEFNGIKDTIFRYSSKGNIKNFVDGLEMGILNDNLEEINYFLNELVLWYENNINEIYANSYVINKDDHKRNMELLIKFKEGLKNCKMENTKKIVENIDEKPLIFISHKSDDKDYGHALEKFIVGLGVENEQLIYTSHPLHKIPFDQNIFQYLREHINSKIFMIILWSNEYLESPACLNEMGAAWVVQCDYSNIYVPTFSFGNPKYHECSVDTNKMGAILNGDEHCKQNMIELKNKILSLFGLDIKENDFVYLLDSFVREICSIEDKPKQKLTAQITTTEKGEKTIPKLKEEYGDGMIDMMTGKLFDEILKQPETQKMINQKTKRSFLTNKKK